MTVSKKAATNTLVCYVPFSRAENFISGASLASFEGSPSEIDGGADSFCRLRNACNKELSEKESNIPELNVFFVDCSFHLSIAFSETLFSLE